MVDCSDLKQKLIECLQNFNLGFDQAYLKFSSKSNIENIDHFKINDNILKKCEYNKYAMCLSKKLKLSPFDDKMLFEQYSKEYSDIVQKIDAKASALNLMEKDSKKHTAK
jgi:hypothetical protein